MMTIIPAEKLKSMLMISRPAKSRNFGIVIYGILEGGVRGDGGGGAAEVSPSEASMKWKI